MSQPIEIRKSLPTYIIAGAIANSVEIIGGQPLDRIKTKLQSEPGLSTRQGIQYIYSQDKIAGFYKGFRWNLMQAAIKGGTRWGINAGSDRFLSSLVREEDRRSHPVIFTTAIAGLSALLDGTVTNITDRAKTFEMSIDKKKEIWQHIRARGIGFFFDGWTRACLKQLSIWSSYQLSFNYLKRHMEEDNQGKPFSNLQKVALGAMPGVCSAFFSTLPDLLKTQAQIKIPLRETMLRSIAKIARLHGIKSLYTSLGVKIVRSAHYSLATYLIMDQLGALPNNMRSK